MTELWLIRHGETQWNRLRRVQGMLNVGLNELGSQQALLVADYFSAAPRGIDAIHSSDLDRARDTAQPTADRLVLPIHLEPGLRERNYGIFEGLNFEELAARHPEAAEAVRQRHPDYALESGESLRAFQQRVVVTLEAIAARRRGQKTLVFTHSGVLDMAYRHAQGLPLEAERKHALLNVSINRLSIDEAGWRVLGWAEIDHLGDLSHAA